MLFARPGEYKPCGIFSLEHFGLIAVTILCIAIAIKNTYKSSKEEVKKIIKNCTIMLWFMEIFIIIFKLCTGDPRNVNNYVPLYYCSILLYAGTLSSFAKGKIKRMGDVFLATGGIIGGIVFILLPTTSLPAYPALHIVSLHSFLYHGIMVYLGLLVNITHYIEVVASDAVYFATLIGIICILAQIVNKIFDSNLMFISKDFPGTPITIIYKLTGKHFTAFMEIAQMFLPFYAVYGILKIRDKRKTKLQG